jgi:hypothetical protein
VKDLIKRLRRNWEKRRGASETALVRTEKLLGVSFPEDYKEFLRWSNGGEGSFGDYALFLWSTDDLICDNDDYEIPQWLPGVIGIGSDGGGNAYILDFRKSPEFPRLAVVPMGALSDECVEPLGDSFREGLLRMLLEG